MATWQTAATGRGKARFRIRGRLTSVGPSLDLFEAAYRAVAAGHAVVFDLSGVTSLSRPVGEAMRDFCADVPAARIDVGWGVLDEGVWMVLEDSGLGALAA